MWTLKRALSLAGMAVAHAALTALFIRSAVNNANRLLPELDAVALAGPKLCTELSEEMTLAAWLDRCGPPDSIISSDELKPRPRLPARVLRYDRQKFRALFMCGYRLTNEKLPPYEEWRLKACYDDDATASFWNGWDGSEKPSLWDGSEDSKIALFLLFPCTMLSPNDAAQRLANDRLP
jgi:hypothetical protein